MDEYRIARIVWMEGWYGKQRAGTGWTEVRLEDGMNVALSRREGTTIKAAKQWKIETSGDSWWICR